MHTHVLIAHTICRMTGISRRACLVDNDLVIPPKSPKIDSELAEHLQRFLPWSGCYSTRKLVHEYVIVNLKREIAHENCRRIKKDLMRAVADRKLRNILVYAEFNEIYRRRFETFLEMNTVPTTFYGICFACRHCNKVDASIINIPPSGKIVDDNELRCIMPFVLRTYLDDVA